LQHAPIDLVLPLTGIRWHGQQVLALRDDYQLWQYYEAETGELLFTWQEALSMGSALDHQYPSSSPDGRWFTIERGGIDSSGTLHKTYHVYDLQSRQEVLLYDRPRHLMEFSGWSPDSETLYLLHLPAGPDAVADPDLSYGLLAYHLPDGDFELLVDDAQAIYWNANYQKALVSVFVQDNPGQATLTAGIWDRSTNQVRGAAIITNLPTQDDFLLHPYSMSRMVSAAWSPDGQQVAFFTWQGDLILMGLDGQMQFLASQVGLGRSDFTRLLAWSPDGSHLFVSDRGTAWVVTIR
jgi:WD40 repeat protein